MGNMQWELGASHLLPRPNVSKRRGGGGGRLEAFCFADASVCTGVTQWVGEANVAGPTALALVHIPCQLGDTGFAALDHLTVTERLSCRSVRPL